MLCNTIFSKMEKKLTSEEKGCRKAMVKMRQAQSCKGAGCI